MAVGLLTLELYLPMIGSLKEKRGVVKPVIARLRRDFNVSVREADEQDTPSRTVIEVVCVSQNSALASRHCRAAVAGHSAPLSASASAVRHRCARHVSGGLYCSGVGSYTWTA